MDHLGSYLALGLSLLITLPTVVTVCFICWRTTGAGSPPEAPPAATLRRLNTQQAVNTRYLRQILRLLEQQPEHNGCGEGNPPLEKTQ